VLHDAFICHASEDKEALVRPLAERLRQERVEVWFDEFSLQVGDSLRRAIDQGLAHSRFGIVILSPDFFEKQWPQWELDGLVVRQNSEPQNVILPVWHGVDEAQVRAYSPPLADKLAVNSSDGLDEVTRRLLTVIHPQGSTLVIARDHLLGWGCDPPVVTDDWWLDIASAADSNWVEGTFQEAMGWGRWGFPLPPASKLPEERGWRLACAAMQTIWQREAETQPITQITHPRVVREFIASQPGLREACHDFVRYLISYAPQLVVRGFGGEFEDAIEAEYKGSIEARRELQRHSPNSGIALTLDGRPPTCDEEVALRDPDFGRYEPSVLACNFVQGDINGPEVRFYAYMDYLAWFLSEASSWLPAGTRELLTAGMGGWGVWPWREHERPIPGFNPNSSTGEFSRQLDEVNSSAAFHPDSKALEDLRHRLTFSSSLLNLPESGNELADRFTGRGVIDQYYEHKAMRASKKRSITT
jgi:hypothetical protein